MLFGELVRDGELGIQVIVASEHATDRIVRAGIITDLPDPSRFLQHDALVLTNAMWWSRDAGAETFVSAVAASGAAALVVGLAEIEVIPDRVVDLCRAAGLTLATAGPGVDFGVVVERIRSAQPDSPATLEREGADLRARLAGSPTISDALSIYLEATGTSSWMLGWSGAVLGAAGELPDPALVGGLWNQLVVDQNDEAGGNLDLRVTAIRGSDGSTAAYLITPAGGRDHLVASLATHLEARLLVTAQRAVDDNRAVERLFDAVRRGTATDGEVAARLRLSGTDLERPLVVVSGFVADSSWPSEATLHLLRDALQARDRGACALLGDGAAVVVTNEVDAAEIGARLQATRPMLADRILRVGISDVLRGVHELGTAISASLVRMRALDGDGSILVADRSAALTHRDLLAQFAGSVRASYAQDVLAPLVDYDEKNGGDLLATLRLFLDNNGAWVETARMLDLHPNTMRYRMSRVEDLTNRDLTRMEDRVDLFLALACLDF